MSTDPRDAIAVMASALQADPTLGPWCAEKLGRSFAIFKEISVTDPPKMSEFAPLVELVIGARMREQNQAHRQATVFINCVLENDGVEKVRVGNERETVTLTGKVLLDEFACRVEAICTKALNSNGYASAQEMAVDDEAARPFFKACWTYTIRCPSRLT